MKVRELLFTTDPYTLLRPMPEDVDGWYSTKQQLHDMIEERRPKLIVEVGTWKGASAIWMGKKVKELGLDCEIVCVDTWLGSLEFWTNKDDPTRYQSLRLQNGYPQVYYQFLSNVFHAGLQDIITPFPLVSTQAAHWFARNKLIADFVYLDASHEFDDVYMDIQHWKPLTNCLCGDDYHLPGVCEALADYEVATGENNFWIIKHK